MQERYEAFIAAENELVRECVAAGSSLSATLRMIALASSSWHYRTNPRARVQAPVPHAKRAYPNRVSAPETARISAAITSGAAAGESIYTCWFTALDAGDPIASLSSWYRIARTLALPRTTRRRATRRASAMPQWQATGPNQVWCWDITKLPGRWIGHWYEMYVVIDVFSRLIIGWRIETIENDDLAAEMLTTAVARHGRPQIVHSDGGSSMTSKEVSKVLDDLGISRSKNRPRVSNDNPFIESWFKTAKYGPGYPGVFTSIDQARNWGQSVIDHYNTARPHSSLAGHTPASVHDGTWTEVHARRQAILTAHAKQHPERYPRPPLLSTPADIVALNPPRTNPRLQTA